MYVIQDTMQKYILPRRLCFLGVVVCQSLLYPIHSVGGITRGTGIWQTTPVLQLPSEVCM